jgi:hypothetical protein
MHLSPEAAMGRLDTIDLEEKSKLAEGISLIAVIDHRRDYLAAAYSSMFSYCTGRLHMSEDKAVRRIEVARLALRVPEVLDHLADGRLSVTTACVLAPHLTPETAAELLAAAAFRSRQEIVQLLAERSRPAVDETLPLDGPTDVEDSSGLSAPVRIDSLAEPCSTREGGPSADPPAPAQANPPRRGQVRTSATGGYDVRLSITDEEHDVLRRATELLGHAVPSGDPALVIARALKHYLAHLEKRRLGTKPGAAAVGNGRGIPKPAAVGLGARRASLRVRERGRPSLRGDSKVGDRSHHTRRPGRSDHGRESPTAVPTAQSIRSRTRAREGARAAQTGHRTVRAREDQGRSQGLQSTEAGSRRSAAGPPR